jgi:hypothetical protein
MDCTLRVRHRNQGQVSVIEMALKKHILAIGMALLAAACASPPLDDAKLEGVRLATSDDFARCAKADEILSRQMFGGASVRDPQRGLITFGKDDYDAFEDYTRGHPLPFPEALTPRGSCGARGGWPALDISFSTRRHLIETDHGLPVAALQLCDKDLDSRPETTPYLKGRISVGSNVMWRGRVVVDQAAGDIDAALTADSQPQSYEIIFPYYYQQNNTLLPPPGDLCLSLTDWSNWPLGGGMGRPLHIDKAAVINALGPLPRDVDPRL